MKRTLFYLFCTMICISAYSQSKDESLDSLYYSLPEAMVTGDKPIVKADKGKLIYDLPHIIKDLPVDNAYDAIKELPGVIESNGSFTLAGRGAKVVIDGKVTNMTSEQLNMLLKSIPASSITNAEVMYSAPARYQVRGAMINITLKKAEGDVSPVLGEVTGKWQYKEKHAFEERASLIFNKNKFSGDVLYSHTHGENFREAGAVSHHTLNDGTVHDIINDAVVNGKGYNHNWRIGVDYLIDKDHSISGVYTGLWSDDYSLQKSSGTYYTFNEYSTNKKMHNARLDYHAPFGLSAGAEMTLYEAPILQTMSDYDGNNILTGTDNQRIIRWKAFVSQEHNTKSGWGINYGVIFNTSTDDSWQKFTGPGDVPEDMSSVQTESILNIYAGFNKTFNGKFMVDISLAGERYHSPMWKMWDLYPNAVAVYMPNKDHLFQLSVSGVKNYPEYWAVKSSTNVGMGGYQQIIGNPDLKPSSSWDGQFVYMLKNKYLLAAWFNYTDDYFVQTEYLHPERLNNIYKWLNFDFHYTAGMQLSIPFKVGKWLDTKLTLTGLYQREKDSDFYDIPFDRGRFGVQARMNNNITISRKPYLLMNIAGNYHSGGIQGIMDIPQGGGLDMSLTWKFNKDRTSLKVGCYDIFETQGVSPYINYGNQVVKNWYPSYRSYNVTFSYRFGAYKEKKREEVDTSRFR